VTERRTAIAMNARDEQFVPLEAARILGERLKGNRNVDAPQNVRVRWIVFERSAPAPTSAILHGISHPPPDADSIPAIHLAPCELPA
jgi:hypothetical protein